MGVIYQIEDALLRDNTSTHLFAAPGFIEREIERYRGEREQRPDPFTVARLTFRAGDVTIIPCTDIPDGEVYLARKVVVQ